MPERDTASSAIGSAATIGAEGYATEAVRPPGATTPSTISTWPELAAAAVPANDASHRVQEKAGFIACDVREARSRPARGHPLQVIVRRLKRTRWQRADRVRVRSADRAAVVAVALVDADGRVLLAQRPEGKADGRPVGVSRRQDP